MKSTETNNEKKRVISIVLPDLTIGGAERQCVELANDFVKIIEEHNGKVIKTEYWGLKQLAYEIKNNKKGHYYFMGIEATKSLLDAIDQKSRISESIIKSSIVRVNNITTEVSPVLKTTNLDNGKTIDVTVNKAPERRN